MSVVSIDNVGNARIVENEVIGKTIFDLLVERFNLQNKLKDEEKSLTRSRQTLQQRINLSRSRFSSALERAKNRSRREVATNEQKVNATRSNINEISNTIDNFKIETDLQKAGVKTLENLFEKFNSFQFSGNEKTRRAQVRSGIINKNKNATIQQISVLKTRLNIKITRNQETGKC